MCKRGINTVSLRQEMHESMNAQKVDYHVYIYHLRTPIGQKLGCVLILRTLHTDSLATPMTALPVKCQ